MAYDADPRTLEWFELALASASTRTRLRALAMLREVDGPRRAAWLAAAECDPDPRVAATAVLVAAAIRLSPEGSEADLFESDFAEGTERDALGWEWEYHVIVCKGLFAPVRGVHVWTREEDDEEARRMAVLKACVGEREHQTVVPIVAGKRFVNRYTRSARSFAEAVKWHHEGRPRYREEDDTSRR